MVQKSVRFHRENIHPYEIFHWDWFEYVQLLFWLDFVQLNEVFVRYVQFLFKEKKTESFRFLSQQISCSLIVNSPAMLVFITRRSFPRFSSDKCCFSDSSSIHIHLFVYNKKTKKHTALISVRLRLKTELMHIVSMDTNFDSISNTIDDWTEL